MPHPVSAAVALLLISVSVDVAASPAVKGVPSSVYTGKRWVTVDFSDGTSKPPTPMIPERPTVHVSISSYRDDLCGRTLYELFSNAKHPELVTVGIVEQFLEGDSRCVEGYCNMVKEETGSDACPYKERVVLIEMEAGEAQGPMHARSFGGKLIEDEEFCLQIDSHIRAVNHWDVKLVEEWSDAENEYAVLSTYVQKVEDLTDRETGSDINKWREVPMMCSTVSGMYGMVRNNQATAARALTRPLRSCYWGAGLSFAKCHMEKSVKHDPHSQGVFDGEEFTRAIRMWTHGYDLYIPSRGIIFHDYNKAQRSPKKWHSNAKHSATHEKLDPAIAYKRLKALLGMEGGSGEDLGEYGLGDKRSKAQYEELCGMELARTPRNLDEGKDICGRLHWVPWGDNVHHPKPTTVQIKMQKPDVVEGQVNEVPHARIVSFHDAYPHPTAAGFPLKGVLLLVGVIVFASASRFVRLRARTRND